MTISADTDDATADEVHLSDWPFTETGGSCTQVWLKELFNNQDPKTRVLTDKYRRPGPLELILLARSLNTTNWMYKLSTTKAKDCRRRAEEVRSAFEALNHFFEARYRQCFSEDGEPRLPDGIIASEELLYNSYNDFCQVMMSHKFLLPMDSTLMMPPGPDTENWRMVVAEISGAFTQAIRRTNPDKIVGNSNQGPRARFVKAIVQQMFGVTVTVENVAKQLKELENGVTRKIRPMRRKT
jgi:hypothetical protein